MKIKLAFKQKRRLILKVLAYVATAFVILYVILVLCINMILLPPLKLSGDLTTLQKNCPEIVLYRVLSNDNSVPLRWFWFDLASNLFGYSHIYVSGIADTIQQKDACLLKSKQYIENYSLTNKNVFIELNISLKHSKQ